MLGGRVNHDTELGTESVSLIVRSIPLRPLGEHIGALVLVRDVTDLRRRDRELVTKDATIREIHHRVKNNLQTVAALLRLQARRMESGTARSALDEAVRRVGSIAIVHETLSQAATESVDFDEVADRLAGLVTDVGGLGGRVRVRRDGSFGVLASETATAVAMVLTELLQNAVEHGYPDADGTVGEIAFEVRRQSGRLRFSVIDDGQGLPGGLRPERIEPPGAVDRGDPGGVRAGRAALAGTRAGWPRHPGHDRGAALAEGRRYAVRTRARALRRFRARRSSSLSPPHTPWSCPASRAHARHCSRTSQRRQTALASSIWRMAGPVLPIGKNSSGSSSRHAER